MTAVMAASDAFADASGTFTVVIDAGHGGSDHGAIGASICEKDINLAVAKRVGRRLKEIMDDVKIVYTRDNDTFITLQGRCDKANRVKGDIFVSIHTNSVDPKSPNYRKVNGASVYTLGLQRSGTNLDVAMRENSVMKLENDYTTTYCGFDPNSAESYIIFEINQSSHLERSIHLADEIQRELITTASRKDLGVRQAPFWVLVRTSMPAVLVELDFICNPEVEKFLGSDKGRDSLAKAISNGIAAYRKSLKSATITAIPPNKDNKGKNGKKNSGQSTDDGDDIIYKVQFLTVPSRLKSNDQRLSGLDNVDSYIHGGAVKYTTGNDKSLKQARKRLAKVKKRYPDAFIIKTRNGQRID